MKTIKLADAWAKQAAVTRSAAADELGGLIHSILRDLRQGQDVRLPGLGTLTRSQEKSVVFQKSAPASAGPRRKP